MNNFLLFLKSFLFVVLFASTEFVARAANDYERRDPRNSNERTYDNARGYTYDRKDGKYDSSNNLGKGHPNYNGFGAGKGYLPYYPLRVVQKSLEPLADGIIVGGSVGSQHTTGDRIWAVKLDDDTGALIWSFEGPHWKFPYDHSMDPLLWHDAVYFGDDKYEVKYDESFSSSSKGQYGL